MFDPDADPFMMSAKDMAMIDHIPELIQAGIDSFKIEGRMKSVHYVATVVRAYRQAIDAYFADPEHYQLKDEWRDEIHKAANRPLNTGFYFHEPGHVDHIFGPENKLIAYDFAGLVLDYDDQTGIAVIQQRNNFKPGQEVEFFGAEQTYFRQQVERIWDEEGHELDAARHPLQTVRMKVEHPVKPFDMMRKKISS